jgi:NAD-dependent dihydropyrimidine dehydrogenase PreA subunit
MKRKIIEIDEEKCDGCELCIPNCPEGAIQMIDGKAKMTNDIFCDGLGACIGHCPQGAINIIERDADAYDEKKVMQNVLAQGEDTLRAHLHHLKEHGETQYLAESVEFLYDSGIEVPDLKPSACPGSQNISFTNKTKTPANVDNVPSALTHWPIQLHLLSPLAPQYKDSDLLLAADCVAFTLGNFHQNYLTGKTLAIACPKLDQSQQIYLEKLTSLIDDANINTLTIMIMQVPCCAGLLNLAQLASENAKRKISLKKVIVGIQGNILGEEVI